jgi:hypothetical protein
VARAVSAERKKRLAVALKANLRRRKAHARSIGGKSATAKAGEPSPENGPQSAAKAD